MPQGSSNGLCFSCRHWDWYVRVFKQEGEERCQDECYSPLELKAGPDVKVCEGYKQEE